MCNSFPISRIGIGLATILIATASAVAGPLEQPLAPPRTVGPPVIDVATLPGNGTNVHLISAPGSYYLSRDVIGETGKNGIGIVTDTVHLDLNGFALIGVSESLHGITLNNRRNVSVSNGTMRNFGGNGLQGTSSVNVRVQDVQVDSNGGWGVGFGDDESGVFGATIVRVVATGNGETVADPGGIFVATDVVISECVAFQNTGDGLKAIFRANILEGGVSI